MTVNTAELQTVIDQVTLMLTELQALAPHFPNSQTVRERISIVADAIIERTPALLAAATAYIAFGDVQASLDKARLDLDHLAASFRAVTESQKSTIEQLQNQLPASGRELTPEQIDAASQAVTQRLLEIHDEDQ